jgi:hypothetical protein
MAQSIGPSLRENWQRFSNKPGGKWLFSRIIGFTVPYPGSIGAKVAHLTRAWQSHSERTSKGQQSFAFSACDCFGESCRNGHRTNFVK